MSHHTQAQDICQIARLLHDKNLLSATDGNITVRLSDGTILITPAGGNKRFLQPADFAVIDTDNRAISGTPSSECRMHTLIYRTCPQAKAVIHAHPPHAIAWSIAFPSDRELPAGAIAEVILGLGRIPIAPYAQPGTDAAADAIAPLLPDCRAVILARHGAIAWGEDLIEALNGIERLEHAAMVLHAARTLGPVTELPAEAQAALRQARAAKNPLGRSY